MIETQFLTKIYISPSCNGMEYFNELFNEFLKDKEIIHQSSTYLDTPQQNGIAKRKTRHLLAIMFSMHVPKYLRGEAIPTTT